MNDRPPRRPTGAGSILFLLALLILIASLGYWAWTRSGKTPNPTNAANPATLPAAPTS